MNNFVIIDVNSKTQAEAILADWNITVANVLSFEEWVGTDRTQLEIAEFCKEQTMQGNLDLCIYTGVCVNVRVPCPNFTVDNLCAIRRFRQQWIPDILSFLATAYLVIKDDSVINVRDHTGPSGYSRPIPLAIYASILTDISDFLHKGVYGSDHPVNVAKQKDGSWSFVPNREWVKWPGLVVEDARYDSRLYAGDVEVPGAFIPAVDLSPVICIRPVDLGYFVVRKDFLPVMLSHITGKPYIPTAYALIRMLRVTTPNTAKGSWTYSRSSQNCSYPDPANPDKFLDIFCYAQTDDNGDLNPTDLTGEHIALCNAGNVHVLLDYITRLEDRINDRNPERVRVGNLVIIKAGNRDQAKLAINLLNMHVDSYLSPDTAESYINDFLTMDEQVSLRNSRPYASMPWLHAFRKHLLTENITVAIFISPEREIENVTLQCADTVIDAASYPYNVIKQRG